LWGAAGGRVDPAIGIDALQAACRTDPDAATAVVGQRRHARVAQSFGAGSDRDKGIVRGIEARQPAAIGTDPQTPLAVYV